MSGRCVIITAHMEGGIRDNFKPDSDDVFLCADGGYAFAENEGINPAAVIGDFDSLGREPALNTGRKQGADLPEIIRLPSEKDDTDTLACAKWGVDKGYREFIIVGGLGGRFDHSYANIQTLSYLTDRGCHSWIMDGGNSVTMIEGGGASGEAALTIPRREGCKFSVFSYDCRCEGVSVDGAKYTLKLAALTQSFPLGVSNEFTAGQDARISVMKGKLLIMISVDSHG